MNKHDEKVNAELKDLYQEVILDHNKKPRNFLKPIGTNCSAEGFNPLCGDKVNVYAVLDGDLVKDIGFQGSGCAISKSSNSIMTMMVKGKRRAEVDDLFEKFHGMITGKPHAPVPPELGKLAVFSGVCEFPSRVKCAILGWHTLRAALAGKGDMVSTEQEDHSLEEGKLKETFEKEGPDGHHCAH